MTLLSDTEKQQVTAAIAAVESQTDAELVTVLAARADDYAHVPVLWAAALALLTPGVLALTPLWFDMWSLLALQWGVFIVLAAVLRLPTLRMRLVPRRLKQWRAAQMARRQFLAQSLHHTRGNTGVLIFVAEAEHYVEVLGDSGISRHVSQEQWQHIVDDFTAKVRKGDTLQGFLDCVGACGALLLQHVPATDQKNELPNHMIVIE